MDTSSVTECPSRETLQAFIDEVLAQKEHAHVARHIEQCEPCQCTLEQLSELQTVVPASTQRLWQGGPPESLGDLQDLVSQLKKLAPAPTSDASSSFRLGQLAIITPSDDPQYLGMIDRYGVVEILGRGGMGVVLKAVDTRLERTVAIKTLLPDLTPSDESKERFLREARSAAALRHDHVVTVHAVEELDGTPYIVMEYIHGQSLAQQISRDGPFPADQVLKLGAQAAAGLAAAHAKGLIHRDVKPANLLLDEETGRLKITDFGLAKLGDDASMTHSGVVAGTPEYMAPEQADGRPVDHRADLFSLGTVLYAALSGKSPFAATSALEALRRVREDNPPPIREVLPDVPPQLADVIERLMAKAPVDRFQSAGEVAKLLSLLAGGQEDLRIPPVAGGIRTSRLNRRHVRWAAAAGALLLVGLVFLLKSDRSEDLQPGPPTTPGFRIVGQEQIYATLAEAITVAGGDDIVEVFGNEVFPIEPIQLEGKPLTIRAAPGYHPILSELVAAGPERLPAIATDARLVLEGLEFRWLAAPPSLPGDDGDADPQSNQFAVQSQSSELYALHCTFRVIGRGACIALDDSDGRFVNCHFVSGDGVAIGWRASPRKRLTVTNSRFEGRTGVHVRRGTTFAPLAAAQLDAQSSTFQSDIAFRWMDVAGPQQRVACRARDCVFQSAFLNVITPGRRVAQAPERPSGVVVPGLFLWSEARNVYAASCRFLAFTRFRSNEPQPPAEGDFTLTDWLRVWRSGNAGSTQLEAGEQPPAGAGADLSQIGPGEAYEQFRESVAYPDWAQSGR